MSFQQKLTDAINAQKAKQQSESNPDANILFTKSDMHIILCMLKDLEAQMIENYTALLILKEFIQTRNQPGVVCGSDLYTTTADQNNPRIIVDGKNPDGENRGI